MSWKRWACVVGLAVVAGCSSGPEAPRFPENEVCPVLGREVDPALTIEHDDRIFGVCSRECVARWEQMENGERADKIADLGH